MAHLLEEWEGRPGEVRMFYAGEVPWHELGTGVAEAVTSAEACELAGLARWDVHLEDFTTSGGSQSAKWRAIVRGLDGKVLGVAMKDWQPVQNERGFAFLDSLVKDGIARYETAGSLDGGSKVWMLMRLESDMHIGDDRYSPYLLLVMGHDRFLSIRLYTSYVRVVCNNTLSVATYNREAVARIIHSGDTEKQFDEAAQAVNLTTGPQRRMAEWLEKQAAKKVSLDQVRSVRDTLFGPLDKETSEKRIDAIVNWTSIYEEERDRVGRTGYALIQTVTGYADHMITLRQRDGNEQKMFSFLGGTGSLFKEKGLQAIARTTKIALPAGIV